MAKKSMRDSMSNLPDEIIIHILSFIPIESAIAASLVSKQWNNLWTWIPSLDFGEVSSARGGYHTRDELMCDKYVNRVLTLNNAQSLREIQLLYQKHHNPDPSRINAWIGSIAQRDTKKLLLKIDNCPNIIFPDSFFDKKMLVKLKLVTDLYKIPRYVSFPNLVSIKLCFTRVDDEYSMKNLFSGCPLLNKFNVYIFKPGRARIFQISSPSLEILKFHIHYKRNDDDCIVIDAPNLTKCILEVECRASYYITSASSLAHLELYGMGGKKVMLQFVRNASIFSNLIRLEFFIHQEKQWQCFPRMLQRATNLVTLELHCREYPVRWKNPKEVPSCLLSCLESVDISFSFVKGGDDWKFISYILEKASSLKKLVIWNSNYLFPEKDVEDLKILSSLPRSSAHCHVYFKGKAINGNPTSAPLIYS